MVKAAVRRYRSALLLLAASAAPAQQYVISTLAGGAPPANTASATGVSIGQPNRVAVDGSGNVYFSSLNSVFKLSANGSLALVAGNSRAGFSGDGGPAVNAQLNSPRGLAFDSSGNLYIADALNNRVRMVTAAGIISTFAGNGLPGAYQTVGDWLPAPQGNLHLPSGVAVDQSGNVLIADTSNHSIRKVDASGPYAGLIHTLAGDTFPGYMGDGLLVVANQTEFQSPEDVAVDPSGNIYIADTGNSYIRKITTDGIINAIAGNGGIGYTGDGGLATGAGLFQPYSISVDSAGDVYIAEAADCRVRMIDTKLDINTIAGNGSPGFAGETGQASAAQLNTPTGVAVDSNGNLYVADSLNGRVRMITKSAAISTVAGNGGYSYSGDGGAAAKAELYLPQAAAVDALGNRYIADSGNHVVRKIAASGIISTLAGTGAAGYGGDGASGAKAQLNTPTGVAADKLGNVYIADSGNHRVRRVASDGSISTYAGNGAPGFAGDGGAAASAQLYTPFGLALDPSGNLYIAELGNSRVRKVSTTGTITTVAGNGTTAYGGDGGLAVNAQLYYPQAVAADAIGNFYIADTLNFRVRMVTAGGLIATVAGNGTAGYSGDLGQATAAQISSPTGVAVDSTGSLYISDGASHVRKVYPNGLIDTVAGNGIRGYSGDGGAATSARINAPGGLSVDSSGNVCFADTANNAVRMLQPSPSGIGIAAVVSSASNLLGPVAPGDLVVLYGSGLGPAGLVQFQLDSNGMVPRSLAGTTVFFNGAAAPLIYTSANQVAALVPFAISGASVQVVTLYQGQLSAPVTVPLAAAAPAIFTLDMSGVGQAAAINQDGIDAVNGAAHPIRIGSYISLYITGAGQTNPTGVDGLPGAVPLPQHALDVSATIGGQQANVQYAGGALGLVAGVMQVNLQIPAGIAPGNSVPVTVQVGTAATPTGVTIAVSN
jgi:uncharacterized protein (TIGR03437 family)